MAHILVIDDDETLRLTLEQFLVSAGHTVAVAADGFEGIKLFRATPFEVIVTDIMMPNRDGLETIIALQRDFPHVGVIAMSGGTSRSPLYLKMAATLGANRTLAKPFRPDELLRLIDAILADNAGKS